MIEHPKLTVGMATFDDFMGVWPTIQALRMYHSEVMDRTEFVIIDNNPGSKDGQRTKSFASWIDDCCRYVPFAEIRGTSVPRDQVFREARGEIVLCLDSHMLLALGALAKIIEFFADPSHEKDMLQGPFRYDNNRATQVMSHMEPVWREKMLGIWGNDPRARLLTVTSDSEAPAPFEIPAQGLALFAMKRQAWIGMGGMSDRFRGFGGEECNLHDKVRQHGGKVWCHPEIWSLHRFTDPETHPPTYANNDYFRVRNYLLWHIELGKPIDEVCEHFAGCIDPDTLDHLTREFGYLPQLQWLSTENEEVKHGLGESAEGVLPDGDIREASVRTAGSVDVPVPELPGGAAGTGDPQQPSAAAEVGWKSLSASDQPTGFWDPR